MATFSVSKGQPSLLQGLAIGGAQGIASGLQQLAADRLADIKQQRSESRLANLLKDVPPAERANLINLLPPEQRLSGLYGLGQAYRDEQHQPQPFVNSQPGLPEPEPTQFAVAQEEQRRQLGLNQPEPQQISPQQLAQDNLALQGGEPTQIKLKQVLDEIQAMGLPRPNKEQRNQIEGMISNFNPEQFNAQSQQQSAPVLPSDVPQSKAAPKKYALEGVSFAKPLTPYEQKRLDLSERKAAALEKQSERDIELEDRKESGEFIKKVRTEHEGARETRKRVERMETLMEKGNFGSPLRNQVINMFRDGILGPHGPKWDITSWMTADSQEMEKLSNEFARGAKDFFPGRVTDSDLKSFMRSVPSLMQTKAGMQRVINSLKSVADAQDLKYKAMRQIIKENGGKRSGLGDIEDRVEDLIGPQLDTLANNFVKGPLVGESGFGAGIWQY